jgi:hypothetical protein
MRLPAKVESIYEEWVRAEKTGSLELHFLKGELKRVKMSAVVDLDLPIRNPTPAIVRRQM